MLSARGVSKSYGSVAALTDISFELEPGRVLALIGPNGAGKTTLIKCLIGVLRFQGMVQIDGIDVARDGRRARSRLGYVPQNPAFHPDMSVAETALFYADLKGVAAARAKQAVESAGLEEHAAKKAGALSGGMRQRLALALAQLAQPPVLIFDEPVAGLDIEARLELRRLILAERDRGTALVLSTHWLEDVPYIADEALVLEAGRAAYLGPAGGLDPAMFGSSRLYLRLNGRSADAAVMIRTLLPGGTVSQSGDWLVVTCRATERARVVENLVVSGVKVLDFRVEETPMRASGGEPAAEGGV